MLWHVSILTIGATHKGSFDTCPVRHLTWCTKLVLRSVHFERWPIARPVSWHVCRGARGTLYKWWKYVLKRVHLDTFRNVQLLKWQVAHSMKISVKRVHCTKLAFATCPNGHVQYKLFWNLPELPHVVLFPFSYDTCDTVCLDTLVALYKVSFSHSSN